MARPEHNTYDFPDDIETVFDVCENEEDLDVAKRMTWAEDKEDYLNLIREQDSGTDLIYLILESFFEYKGNKEKAEFYHNMISKDYADRIA